MPVKCKFIGCDITATFGIEKRTHCSTHKTDKMKSFNKPRKCEFEDCGVVPSYALEGEKAKYCNKHKLKDMVNVIVKKCEFEDCRVVASYGFKWENFTRCKKHKLIGMKNSRNKKCEFKNCDLRASYALKGGKATRCSKHKLKDMINVNVKKCEFEGCEKGPSYAFKGEEAIRCSRHKLSKMIDVRSKKCTSCGMYVVFKRTNYLCSYCSPNASQKTKEDEIKKLLEANCLKFIHDKQFQNGCYLKYRPDFLFDCGKYFVVLECDENAHKGYEQDCEFARMNNITLGLGLPTVFIRYNPDLKGVKTEIKHQKLLETLNNYLHMDLLIDPSPVYLFYA